MLILLRILVAIFEGPAGPLSFSVISDVFSLRSGRSTAMGIFQACINVGAAAGSAVGGIVVDWAGWQAAFALVPLPSFVVAVLIVLTAREPHRNKAQCTHVKQREEDDEACELDTERGLERASQYTAVSSAAQSIASGTPTPTSRHALAKAAAVEAETLSQSIRRVFSSRTYQCFFVGFVGHAALVAATDAWMPALFHRSSVLSTAQVGGGLGLAILSGSTAKLAGGLLVEWLGTLDLRWYCWLPAICKALTLVSYLVWFHLMSTHQHDASWALWGLRLLCVPYFLNGFQAAPELTMSVSCCDSHHRGLANAIFAVGGALTNSCTNALVGMLSDSSTAMHGSAGALRQAMELSACIAISVSIVAFLLASLVIRGELAVC